MIFFNKKIFQYIKVVTQNISKDNNKENKRSYRIQKYKKEGNISILIQIF